MTLRYFFIVIFWLSAGNLLGQQKIDSLKTLLSDGDSDRRELLNDIANAFLRLNQLDSALKYYKEGIEISEFEGNRNYVAANANNIGVIYFEKGSFDSSIYYYQRAREEYRLLENTYRVAMADLNIGMAYLKLGEFEKSIALLLNSIGEFELKNNLDMLSTGYSTLGNLFNKTGDYNKSLFYHKQAYNVNLQLKNKRKIALSLNNLGTVYNYLNQKDSSLYFFMESLKIRQNENLDGIGLVMGNIGGMLSEQGKYEEAQEYLLESLKLARSEGRRYDELRALNNIAPNYIKMEQFDEALQVITEGKALAEELRAKDENKENQRLFILYYSAIGDDKKLEAALDKYDNLKDSLLNSDKAKSLADMEVKYETEKKEKEIALLQRERELQEAEIQLRENWIGSLLVVSLLVLVIGVLVYRNSRITRKNKKKVELLLKELQHRVKNNLQIISSLLSLQSQQLTDTHAREAIKSGENRVNAMAMIHRRLYTSEKVSELNINEYIREIVQYLVQTYGYNSDSVKLNLSIDDKMLDLDKAIPLGLIVNELVSNALKYGVDKKITSQIIIELRVYSEEITLKVSDNGPGLPATFNIENLKSLGLKIVRLLINDLHGVLDLESKNGTTYIIKIPAIYGKDQSSSH